MMMAMVRRPEAPGSPAAVSGLVRISLPLLYSADVTVPLPCLSTSRARPRAARQELGCRPATPTGVLSPRAGSPPGG